MSRKLINRISKRLMEQRALVRLSLHQAAGRCGVDDSTLGRYERGEPQHMSVAILERMAHGYGKDLVWLVGE